MGSRRLGLGGKQHSERADAGAGEHPFLHRG
jgi:hypothetical protein